MVGRSSVSLIMVAYMDTDGSMDNIPVVTPLKKMTLPSSSHWLPAVPQEGVGFVSPSPAVIQY